MLYTGSAVVAPLPVANALPAVSALPVVAEPPDVDVPSVAAMIPYGHWAVCRKIIQINKLILAPSGQTVDLVEPHESKKERLT